VPGAGDAGRASPDRGVMLHPREGRALRDGITGGPARSRTRGRDDQRNRTARRKAQVLGLGPGRRRALQGRARGARCDVRPPPGHRGRPPAGSTARGGAGPARPRLSPPASLGPTFSSDPYDRAAHTYGRSFRHLVRASRRDYAHAPDLVAFPRDERDVTSVLEWCSGAGAAAIPFGGGSSVAGGVEPDVGESYHGAVSVDLGHLDGVLKVDGAPAVTTRRFTRTSSSSRRCGS
jgi:hypothetical protein